MKRFEVGTILVICGLYTGDYLEKIISRTEHEIVTQELDYPNSEPNRRTVKVDFEYGTEKFLNWEYKDSKSHVYPDSTPEIIYGR